MFENNNKRRNKTKFMLKAHVSKHCPRTFVDRKHTKLFLSSVYFETVFCTQQNALRVNNVLKQNALAINGWTME